MSGLVVNNIVDCVWAMIVINVEFLRSPFIHQVDHIVYNLRSGSHIMIKATLRVNTLFNYMTWCIMGHDRDHIITMITPHLI